MLNGLVSNKSSVISPSMRLMKVEIKKKKKKKKRKREDSLTQLINSLDYYGSY